MAGGKAIRITPSHPNPRFEFDGLILSGGADIHPERYKEKLVQTIKVESKNLRRWNKSMILSVFVWVFRKLFSLKVSVSPNESKMRDALEFGLLEEAVKKCVPVLGICRGAQLINVFFGGTLFQDIKPFYIETPELHTALPRQRVFIEHDSQLYKVFQKSFVQVNSLHFQSVNRLGKGLRVTATDENGIVEAVEHTQCPFVVGVQWHPEFLLFHETQRRLFEDLVSRARLSLENRPELPRFISG